ncbi:expressed unknown protein [Seminavis robusta]|uniref:Uncharacterized protein n=1 Tax=Seminavis robusta TaxID=568900 RepID=A0A9N8DBC1_9STRA|nr:expressed unknown protein [Seminavis robusta]|eukprot:Sro23_g015680.1 n/a (278) ;mRNA; r:45847-46680
MAKPVPTSSEYPTEVSLPTSPCSFDMSVSSIEVSVVSLEMEQRREKRRRRKSSHQQSHEKTALRRSLSDEENKARWQGVNAIDDKQTLSVPRRKRSHPILLDVDEETMTNEEEDKSNWNADRFSSHSSSRHISNEEEEENRRWNVDRFSNQNRTTSTRRLARKDSFGVQELTQSLDVSARSPRLPRRTASSNRNLLEFADDDCTNDDAHNSSKILIPQDQLMPDLTEFGPRQVSNDASCFEVLPPELPIRKESVLDLKFHASRSHDCFQHTSQECPS